MNTSKYFAVIAVLGLCGFASQAKADFVSDLQIGGTGLSGQTFSGPFARVSITLTDSTHAAVTFTSHQFFTDFIYLMGSPQAVALNVNATSFFVVHPVPGSLSGFIGTNSGTGFTPGPFVNNSNLNLVGQFGTFNLVAGENSNDFTHTADSITFTLNNLSGTWASDRDVLTPNSRGFDAAAFIFVTRFPADAENGSIARGFAGERSAPDGGTTIMLLGAALGALGMARRFLMS